MATPVTLATGLVDPHPVTLTPPFFVVPPGGQGTASGVAGTTLHRYQDTEFIPRFLTDLAAGRVGDPTRADWWSGDRFSGHDERLVLRLPVHRTFYLVVCEVVCDRLKRPALDPARIASAGFVIRRVGGPAQRLGSRLEARRRARAGRPAQALGTNPGDTLVEGLGGQDELAWILEDGEPLGWQPANIGGRDPDLGRRLCPDGASRSATAGQTYNGEETHPLHPVLVRHGGRPHTLLYGFLPLGGQFLTRGSPFTGMEERGALAAEQGLLPWPFGFRDRADLVWRASDERLVDRGRPTRAFFALLEVLVNRYHLGESPDGGGDPLNEGLVQAARRLAFIDESAPANRARSSGLGTPRQDVWIAPDRARPAAQVGLTLWDYLSSCFAAGEANPLPAWLSRERQAIDATGGLDLAAPTGRLPARPEDGAGELDLSLAIEAADAQEWRHVLGQRLIDQARRTGAELPIPKFRQEPEDLYQVVPFVRALDDQGRERIVWAAQAMRSEPFRVAAPFDPDASRPVLIQMPSLRDLKRGMAKGAAMLVPPDTQQMLSALKLDQGVGPDLVPPQPPEGAGLGIQWLCSFSLPVITLVAMILLMIMVILLNLVFFWLPWVRICLPFPKLK